MKSRNGDFTAAELRALIDYRPETGEMVWRGGRPGCVAGKRAGHVDPRGYLYVGIHGRRFLGHRIAWLYMTGEWPSKQIDHRNCNKADLRFDNLREASDTDNRGNAPISKNNTSGAKGVSWDKTKGKYEAYICPGGKKKSLGRYDSLDDAAKAYAEAATHHFGEFARAV